MTNIFDKAYEKRPLQDLLSREIDISIVGKRCIYINDFRVQGGKPYVSENLESDTRKTTIRNVLDAFSIQELEAYIKEKIALDAYCAGLRNYRDAEKNERCNKIGEIYEIGSGKEVLNENR